MLNIQIGSRVRYRVFYPDKNEYVYILGTVESVTDKEIKLKIGKPRLTITPDKFDRIEVIANSRR